MQKVLLICTGNTCRSPMAQYFMQESLHSMSQFDIVVRSAGLATSDSLSASDLAIRVLGEKGIDLRSHRSTKLTQQLLEENDLILTMTQSQKLYLLAYITKKEPMIYTLAEYAGLPEEEVADPYGQDILVYRRTADQIERLVRCCAERLVNCGERNCDCL